MSKKNVLKELSIYLFNRIMGIYKGEDILPNICNVILNGKEIPKKAYDLIPDKRYHKQFDILYGFMWFLRKIKKPNYVLYFSVLVEISRKLKIPQVDDTRIRNLILLTLIIEFFEENPAVSD